MAFLEACGLLRSGQRILDIACGGGRHSLAMARRGALVTGIDLGPAAIATARRRAHKAGLAVEFVQGDVRAMEYEAVFDAATFIFGCFTEMSRHDAAEVLQRISRSLRPGGMFVLDVYAPCFFAALDGAQEWWVGQDFIAGRFPQLILTEYFYYAREKTYARRDFICDARTGAIHTFGVSGQAYALPELCGMIEAAGLSPTMVYGGWQGEEVRSDSQMYIVLAAKRPSPLVEPTGALRRQETS
jgi:SAM-dependent methyltransferase